MADSTIQQKLTAEVLGTFVLVFFGCGAASSISRQATSRRRSALDVRPHGHGDGLRLRPDLRRALQPGRLGRRRARRPDGVAPGRRSTSAPSSSARSSPALVALRPDAGLRRLRRPSGNMAQNSFGDQGSGYAWWAAFLLELVMTAVFVSVILAVTDERNEHPALAPLAIGLTLTMIHFVVDPGHRHLGQPGPLDRRRRSSPAPTRSSSCGCSSSPRCSAPRSPDSPTRCSSAGSASRPRLRAQLQPAAHRPPRCPATPRPTSTSSSGTSRPPRSRPPGAGADHPGRLAVGPGRPAVAPGRLDARAVAARSRPPSTAAAPAVGAEQRPRSTSRSPSRRRAAAGRAVTPGDGGTQIRPPELSQPLTALQPATVAGPRSAPRPGRRRARRTAPLSCPARARRGHVGDQRGRRTTRRGPSAGRRAPAPSATSSTTPGRYAAR